MLTLAAISGRAKRPSAKRRRQKTACSKRPSLYQHPLCANEAALPNDSNDDYDDDDDDVHADDDDDDADDDDHVCQERQ